MDVEKIVKVLEGALRDFADEVRAETLREIEQSLRVAVGGAPKVRAGKPGRPPKAAKPAKDGAKRGRPTKASAARKLQGRYMGMLRRYDGKAKAAFKALREKQGTEAAIAAMVKANGYTPKAAPKAVAKKVAKKAVVKKAKAAKPALKVVASKPKDETARLAAVIAKAAKSDAAKDTSKDTPAPQGA
jgi:hypothetical protein